MQKTAVAPEDLVVGVPCDALKARRRVDERRVMQRRIRDGECAVVVDWAQVDFRLWSVDYLCQDADDVDVGL